MDQSHRHTLDSTRWQRNDALRRLVERYELGELSDEAFTERKRQILRDGALDDGVPSANIDLIVATFADHASMEAALGSLRSPEHRRAPRIIDIAMLGRNRSGSIRISVLPALTRPPVAGSISIISAICGLLFPGRSLLTLHSGTPLAASLRSFSASEDEQAALHSTGASIPNGTISIVLVCWTAVAGTLETALHTADYVTTRTLSDAVAGDICDVLTGSMDVSWQSEPDGGR